MYWKEKVAPASLDSTHPAVEPPSNRYTEKDHIGASRSRWRGRKRPRPFAHSSQEKARGAGHLMKAAGVRLRLLGPESRRRSAAWGIRVPFPRLRRSRRSHLQREPLRVRIFQDRTQPEGWAARKPIGSLARLQADSLPDHPESEMTSPPSVSR